MVEWERRYYTETLSINTVIWQHYLDKITKARRTDKEGSTVRS